MAERTRLGYDPHDDPEKVTVSGQYRSKQNPDGSYSYGYWWYGDIGLKEAFIMAEACDLTIVMYDFHPDTGERFLPDGLEERLEAYAKEHSLIKSDTIHGNASQYKLGHRP